MLTTLDSRSLNAAALTLLNSLAAHIRVIESLGSFKNM